MKVAIIIVTYNGRAYISQCLQSVLAARFSDSFDILVIDNASTDDTAAIIKTKFPRVKLIELKTNAGFAGGNNVGLRLALAQGAEAAVLLNQDTYVEPDWLEELAAAAFSKSDIGIAQAMLLLADDHGRVNNLGNAWHYLGFGFAKHYRALAEEQKAKAPFAIGYASGAAMLVKREVLEKAGMFDEKFYMYHEDLDLAWRARLRGYEIILAPRAVVYHYYRFRRNQLMYYWTERNRAAVLLQNYSFKTLLLLAPMLLITELMILIYSAAHGWLLQKLRSYAWILWHLPGILKQRSEIQSRRQVSDKIIMQRMDSSLEFSEIKNSVLTYLVNPAVKLYYKLICQM